MFPRCRAGGRLAGAEEGIARARPPETGGAAVADSSRRGGRLSRAEAHTVMALAAAGMARIEASATRRVTAALLSADMTGETAARDVAAGAAIGIGAKAEESARPAASRVLRIISMGVGGVISDLISLPLCAGVVSERGLVRSVEPERAVEPGGDFF